MGYYALFSEFSDKQIVRYRKGGYMNSLRKWKIQFVVGSAVLLISLISLISVTFAWYVYQMEVSTSDIHMAVGTGNALQISNQYDGVYGTSTVIDEFHGALVPVSTNRILGGFQKVTGFTEDPNKPKRLVATFFGESATADYYKTTLFLRVSGKQQDLYIADIGYEDSDKNNPVSTAIRIGFVIHEPGQDKPPAKEVFIAINTNSNPRADYNTATGEEGYVLDSSKTDGSTVRMEGVMTPDNYCFYNPNNGEVFLNPLSKAICTLPGGESGNYGTPVQIDVYVWLEGCDKDCCDNLSGNMLKKVALSFAGKVRED